MDRQQIAEEVLAAVGGRDNVTANDICMTRLRIKTENPSLVDTDQLSAARGVLGFVKRGENGIEVVFGPGKVEAVHEALVRLTGIEGNEEAFDEASAMPSPIHVHISRNPLRTAALAQSEGDVDAAPEGPSEEAHASASRGDASRRALVHDPTVPFDEAALQRLERLAELYRKD